MRTRAEQPAAELRARVEYVLTVVQQQHHIPIGQVPPDCISHCVPPRAANAEHTRRLGSDVCCPAHRGKINQPDAIGPLPRLTTAELDGRSGLAHTAGPVSVTSRALRSMSLTAWSSDARPTNAVRGAGMEGTGHDGPFCSRRSSSRPTTEFWHHTIAFRSLPNTPLNDQGSPAEFGTRLLSDYRVDHCEGHAGRDRRNP